MNFARINICALLFSGLTAFAQTNVKDVSRIVRSNPSDTALLHLEISEGNYDFQKGKLPYFLISNPKSYNESAIPTLISKITKVVAEPHASVIKKYFSQYIKKEFVLEEISSLSKNQNLNHYKVFPFRLNSLNQLEELITYDVNWQVIKNNNSAARGTSSFVNNSVLSSGTWYKIGVTQTGIHRISRSFLSGIGINVNTLDPKKLKVYGNGGKMVPELNGAFRHDDLQENAIRVVLAADSSFDYALFFATGPTEWKKTNSTTSLKYRATKNLYTDTSFYYINVDQGLGKRMLSQSSLSQSPDVTSSSYDYYNFHEVNAINFGKSGRQFYGEYFDLISTYSFPWNDGDFVSSDTLLTEVTLAATHNDTSGFSVAGNGINLHLSTAPINGTMYGDYASVTTRFGKGINQNPNSINISITKLTPRSTGWLDKLTINTRRNLVLKTKQFSFRDSRVTKYMGLPNQTCKFSISTFGSGILLWNVSDPINPINQGYNANGSGIDFTANVDSLNEYCIAPSSDLFTPVFVGRVANQNLHSIAQANYLIITHPLFIKEAQRMGVFHQQKEGLSYAVATTDQIFNEFGSGKPDVSAIRDFIRMIYLRNINLPENQQLKYVLLMGDGSYDNKNRNLVNNSNLVPTYQSVNSLDPIESTVTDDFYGLMDPNEGANAESFGALDIAIGRFTCRTVAEVKAVIAKIESYYSKENDFVANNMSSSTESVMGDWRNWLLFLGDDGDGALHMSQSDSLVRIVKKIAPNYNVENIFLDAYQLLSTPGGNRFPDAAEDFLKRIKKGTLIFNYTGHGGEVGLTAERMIDIDIINNMDNIKKLPLFITATCEFSKFDDPGRTSAGELCLINPKGGAIGLFTTCRVAYANFNLTLNVLAIEKLFTRLPNGKWPALGDAMLATKAALGQKYYYANFHLLGDPALTLSYPTDKVVTSQINNVSVSPTSLDTLTGLSKITVSGFVADNAGNKLSNFNGLVYPTVFDKEQTVFTLMNTDDSKYLIGAGTTTAYYGPFQFKLQKNILYRGKSKATNGEFSFSFIVPKDISFALGRGRISYYATDGTMDAAGSYTQLIVGGASTKNTFVDNDGPLVTLYLNDEHFINGGITNEKPLFFADLVDSTGINTLGASIGHDMSVILDENSSKPVILNDYYESNLNSYQSGRVRYPYSQISDGEHRLTFKVWDIQNNSTTAYLDFVVAKSAELALERVLNYPNPFTTRTRFMFKHNQSCNPLKVTVQIYTISGKVVKTIQRTTSCESFAEGIEWDGRDDYGDKLARGVYIYKLAILDVDNKKAEKIEKLVILN